MNGGAPKTLLKS